MEGFSIPKLTNTLISADKKIKKKKKNVSILNITKVMRNHFTEYKTLLHTFSLEEQIDEINDMIK